VFPQKSEVVLNTVLSATALARNKKNYESVYFTYLGAAIMNRSQSVCSHLVITPTLSNVQNFILIDRVVSVWSASRNDLIIPRIRLVTCQRAFSVAAPRAWNGLHSDRYRKVNLLNLVSKRFYSVLPTTTIHFLLTTCNALPGLFCRQRAINACMYCNVMLLPNLTRFHRHTRSSITQWLAPPRLLVKIGDVI
jgi:hypothetical protein